MAFEFRLPDIGEGVVEGEIVKWFVKEGDQLEEDQPMVEVMTDKATVEIPSPRSGRVLACRGNEGDVVDVGDVLVVIEEADGGAVEDRKPAPAADKPAARPEPKKESAPPAATPKGRVLATPAVRRRARELGIDLSLVQGSGSGGRIAHEDLDRLRVRGESPSRPSAPASPEVGEGEVERIPYRALRKRIGDQMSISKRTIPHFTYVEEVDMTELGRLRRQLNQLPEAEGVKITYLPFFVKAVIKSLKKHPIVNSSLDEGAGEILIRKYYNIGVAVATEHGLIVPVIKDADRKDILQLAGEIDGLASAARAGRSELSSLRGGTFTITSLGALGGILATPIVNHPEVAILGVHKISPRPVVRDGEIVIREMAHLSVSMDHRVVDGATGAKFLNDVIPFLENPARLLI